MKGNWRVIGRAACCLLVGRQAARGPRPASNRSAPSRQPCQPLRRQHAPQRPAAAAAALQPPAGPGRPRGGLRQPRRRKPYPATWPSARNALLAGGGPVRHRLIDTLQRRVVTRWTYTADARTKGMMSTYSGLKVRRENGATHLYWSASNGGTRQSGCWRPEYATGSCT
ncbi:MAG: hypothetical protein WKG07_11490 [Hymenobacter sp.]